ncbi:hypothetical protein [Terriglobus albidus]|uniref:hypothetical protein n=1 Tax=Terriglobus albidus TaxID=1592106 RepID=UPI0021DF6E25|nr:hypothetical protein [Terriglobus albidus]
MRRVLGRVAVARGMGFARGAVFAVVSCTLMAGQTMGAPTLPNTVPLSQMVRELSAQPGFTEKLLAAIGGGQKAGAVLTPKLFDLLRSLILGKDWSGLDRFPGWTIGRVNGTVDLGTRIFGEKLKPATRTLTQWVTLGPYTLESPQTEDLDKPSERGELKAEITDLGAEVTRGDGPDPELAPLHAESQRLAEVLNRLSLNRLDDAQSFGATIGGSTVHTPEELIDALAASGHRITVSDVRYFANFGHFHYKGQDVMMPFFLDSQLLVPADHWWQRRRHLLVPVAHAEYELMVEGPRLHADVTFYFGIDGRAEFRTNDLLNQPWVMGRHAHEYAGAQAREVIRLLGSFTAAYARLHLANPQLPFGGYYTLGVCQDAVSAIELKMTGKTTLFPNTAQTEFFNDAKDAEVNALLAAIPKDRDGVAPAPERIFGSLPTTDFSTITVPGLREDVQRSYAAHQRGELVRSPGVWQWVLEGIAFIASIILSLWGYRRYQKMQE